MRLFSPKFFLILFLLHTFYCKDNRPNLYLPDPPKGGNFSLQSENRKISLDELKGNIVILYFGFISCPDVCPTTLSIFANTLKELNHISRSKVKFIFIDVDPERDSLERITAYTNFFHPDIIPMTGSIDEIKKVAELYGASFHKVDIKSKMGYTMDHSTNLFVINPSGKWVMTLPHGTKKEIILKTISDLLNE